MILSDSDVFLIDRIYIRDDRYEANRRFIEKLPELDAANCMEFSSSIPKTPGELLRSTSGISQSRCLGWFLKR